MREKSFSKRPQYDQQEDKFFSQNTITSQIICYGTVNKYNCSIKKRGTPLKEIIIFSQYQETYTEHTQTFTRYFIGHSMPSITKKLHGDSYK